MRGKLAGTVAARGLTVALAVVAFLVRALTPVTGWGAALAVAAGAALVERWVRPAADLVPEQILLAAGVLAAYADSRYPVDWVVVAAGAVLIGLIMMEGSCAPPRRSTSPPCASNRTTPSHRDCAYPLKGAAPC